MTFDTPYKPGQYYQFAVPGGFLMYGEYVRPIGLGQHEFKDVRYQLNGGGRRLSEICRSGPADVSEYSAAWPGAWFGCPIWVAEYTAENKPSDN